MKGVGCYILGGPDGRTPILEEDLFEWAKWYETRETTCRVAWTEIANAGVVSTIFLGLDHGFMQDRPVLFETMSKFGANADWGDDYFDRYSTWDEALAGHNRIVAEILKAVEHAADRVSDLLVPGGPKVEEGSGK